MHATRELSQRRVSILLFIYVDEIRDLKLSLITEKKQERFWHNYYQNKIISEVTDLVILEVIFTLVILSSCMYYTAPQ